MDGFRVFANALDARFTALSGDELYVVGDALDRDSLWLTYLAGFPAGTDPLLRERTEHDCATCRQFVEQLGPVVAIRDGRVVSLWGGLDVPAPYDAVAAAVDAFVRSLPLSGVFRAAERRYGAPVSRSLRDGRPETWHHLHGTVAGRHRSRQVATDRADAAAAVAVFRRGLDELSPAALDAVVELIDDNALYRGEEHLRAVTGFRSLRHAYAQAPDPAAFVWANARHPAARLRGTVIGTLVRDLSAGVELERAVRAFEAKVAPTTYRRPKALITPAMVRAAMTAVAELGIERSLERRHARIGDVSVTNVLWVDNDTQPRMKDGLEGLLMAAATPARPLPRDARPEPVGITAFMKDVLPAADAVELLVRDAHANNFVSVTTGVHPDAPRLFRWDNDFAWSYGGDVADSIREKVKRAGGDVTGALRVSLSWFNLDDLDLHVYEPDGTHIWYRDKQGKLDVDMNAGAGRTREPVENVTWTGRVADGDYRVEVDQYCRRETTDVGFVIETESDGVIENVRYDRPVEGTVAVGTMTVRGGVVTAFRPGRDVAAGGRGRTVWSVDTERFTPVSTVLYSPNHWDGNAVGNRHWFFVLQGCRTDAAVRGIYNEFLRDDLHPHRKVFEVLGDRTKCPPADEQLSGLGFSSTARAAVTARVTGAGRRRLVTIQF